MSINVDKMDPKNVASPRKPKTVCIIIIRTYTHNKSQSQQ